MSLNKNVVSRYRYKKANEDDWDWDWVGDEVLEGMFLDNPGKEFREFAVDIGHDPDSNIYVDEDGDFDEIMWEEDIKSTIDYMVSDEDYSLIELLNL